MLNVSIFTITTEKPLPLYNETLVIKNEKNRIDFSNKRNTIFWTLSIQYSFLLGFDNDDIGMSYFRKVTSFLGHRREKERPVKAA